ncbi:MAG: class I SAM-dependent methyltransferase [Pseudomonadota bacterium]
MRPAARVLDLGCAGGYMGEALKRKGCRVVGVDLFPLEADVALDGFVQHDLNRGMPPLDLAGFDYVLLLDVLEHVAAPEQFVAELRHAARFAPDLKVVVSTGNIAFLLARLSLLAGRFNYGKRGLLDLTHARLFTFGTLRRLFDQAGFEILTVKGAPVPFPARHRRQRARPAAAGDQSAVDPNPAAAVRLSGVPGGAAAPVLALSARPGAQLVAPARRQRRRRIALSRRSAPSG